MVQENALSALFMNMRTAVLPADRRADYLFAAAVLPTFLDRFHRARAAALFSGFGFAGGWAGGGGGDRHASRSARG